MEKEIELETIRVDESCDLSYFEATQNSISENEQREPDLKVLQKLFGIPPKYNLNSVAIEIPLFSTKQEVSSF